MLVKKPPSSPTSKKIGLVPSHPSRYRPAIAPPAKAEMTARPNCEARLAADQPFIGADGYALVYQPPECTKKDRRGRETKYQTQQTARPLMAGQMVPKVGLEPAREYSHYALNVARLPIPPLRPASPTIPNSMVTLDHALGF